MHRQDASSTYSSIPTQFITPNVSIVSISSKLVLLESFLQSLEQTRMAQGPM